MHDFSLIQWFFLLIGCAACVALLYLMWPKKLQRPHKSKVYHAKTVITRFESQLFFRLKTAFPQHHVLAQVAFTALITSQDIRIRNKFNRKVTDFVLLDQKLQVVAIIELDDPSHIGREQQDAERDAMFHDAGYRVFRYTKIPTVRQLQKDIL